MTLTIRCDHCGQVHDFWVIPLFSNPKKGKFVVFCWKKLKFATWYNG